ncbi:MAG: hypothetical protein ACREJC_19890 [Tepidisphaeraceae bacterium]
MKTRIARSLVTFVISGAALAQETVRIAISMPPGTAWTFVQNEDWTMDSTVEADGKQQQTTQSVSRKITGSAEVLASDASGVPTSMRLTFDPASGARATQNGRSAPIPFPLAGQTVIVRMDNGKFSHDFRGKLDPDSEQELRSLLDQDAGFLPANPVRVGDTWSTDPRKVAEKWQIDLKDSKVDIRMTLREIKQIERRNVAVVDMNADMSGPIPGMPGVSGRRKLTGVALIDTQTGRLVGGDVNGTMTMSGIRRQQASNGATTLMEINSRGTIATHTESKIKAAPGAS